MSNQSKFGAATQFAVLGGCAHCALFPGVNMTPLQVKCNCMCSVIYDSVESTLESYPVIRSISIYSMVFVICLALPDPVNGTIP